MISPIKVILPISISLLKLAVMHPHLKSFTPLHFLAPYFHPWRDVNDWIQSFTPLHFLAPYFHPWRDVNLKSFTPLHFPAPYFHSWRDVNLNRYIPPLCWTDQFNYLLLTLIDVSGVVILSITPVAITFHTSIHSSFLHTPPLITTNHWQLSLITNSHCFDGFKIAKEIIGI